MLLILDASGSMRARLPNGETRIAVAQRAACCEVEAEKLLAAGTEDVLDGNKIPFKAAEGGVLEVKPQ